MIRLKTRVLTSDSKEIGEINIPRIIDVYWVEVGNHFIVANDNTPDGIEVGRLSEFNIDALSKNTLNDYLAQEHFREFNLIELFQH